MQAVPIEQIEHLIYLIRGQRVILSADLAALYGVVTWRLHEQVKRNQARFPDDFVFQLTSEEDRALTSQIARSKPGRGGRRTLIRLYRAWGHHGGNGVEQPQCSGNERAGRPGVRAATSTGWYECGHG
ncbi:ORF6N domain-containing protein [Candidatus Methylomirabilis sp.]|uniref:ORF6N domain-containing protein n=1 Tax=Candidatus Methylomirabilis sp. TaxID=2032687 RepID=UPI0030766D54